MHWTSIDWWIVAVGAVSAVACALPGNFLVLRRMSMMGDAISHAVLPGLAVAFLVTGSRADWPMFLGAAVVGLLTALFTQWITRLGKVEESASMGVVFTTLFAIGLIVIVRAADQVDLDPGCVLYGAIELTPLDTVRVAGQDVPRVFLSVSGVLLVNALCILLLYKELKITSFDPELATSIGIPASRLHYALMTIVAITTVACFESVGSILVIAMLVVPPAAAYLLTNRLGVMIMLSVLFAALSAVGGHAAALSMPGWLGFKGLDTSTSGMMAVTSGVVFFAALIGSPRHGVVARLWRRQRLGVTILCEDILGLLYRLEERGQDPRVAAAPLLRRALGVGRLPLQSALWLLQWTGKIRRARGDYAVTDTGREAAHQLVRVHRLWESYLQKHLDLRDVHAHSAAERLEHIAGVDPEKHA